ncbi:hypothetical protein D9756_009866 [Leucocoprinus leucothites]|uniref:Uncharacterized protein n=1 Tax=Leucocoprinus leucothites TaxID=201217 RepID=A0A8H5CWT2_9AGAR|nr:hypothetical protein D9756_009866 [Leucoagaricus leucothites]
MLRPPSRGSSGSRAITPHISQAQTPETRASSDEEDNTRPLIPVQFSPVKQCQKAKAANQVADKHNLDIWDLPDDEIIEASFAHLKSLAYQHFNITLDHVLKDDEPSELVFIFTCKTNLDCHTAHHRGCMKTHTGTGNLQKGIKACNWLNGLAEDGSSLCPFNSVKDGLYHLEVAILQKETVLPSPEQSITGGIHLVLDRWTAPIVASYLGLVIIWSEQGTIYRTVLEFIRLKHKHTGEYLAKVVFDCLKCWGLTKKMFMSFFFKKDKTKSNQAIISDNGLVSVDDHLTFVTDQVVEDKDDEDYGVLEEDDSHGIFNQEAVLALHQPAIMQIQAREEPVTATPAQLHTAEGIMPWEVETMTGISDNNLTQYQLSADQWKIVTDFLPVLEIFKKATDLFSKAEVPLIVDAFPLLLDIQTYLVNQVTNKYMKKPTAAKPTAGKLDDICTYLKEPVIQSSTVIDSGASSVDAKWAFLVGQQQINFMQLNMSPSTFEARMGLGSWYGSPLFPGIKAAAAIIEGKVSEDSDEE